jgi:hypothetical protein
MKRNTLRRTLDHRINNDESDHKRIIQALPVAYPIVDVVFDEIEIIPEKVGLINRTILEGIREFGPCSAEDLKTWTGIETDIIETTLATLQLSIDDLKLADQYYTIGKKGVEIIESDLYTRRNKQRRKYVINGLTDELLPFDFWKGQKHSTLLPTKNARNKMQTSTGDTSDVNLKMVDRSVSGEKHISKLISEGSIEQKKLVGLSVDTTHATPDISTTVRKWVAAFILVYGDKQVQVVSAFGNHTFIPKGDRPKRYFRDICRGDERRHLKKGHSFFPDSGWKSSWPEKTRIKKSRRTGDVLIKIPQIDELDYVQSDKSKEWMSDALREGHRWEHYSGNVYYMRPATKDVARVMRLLRCLHDLKNRLNNIDYLPQEQPPLEVEDWLAEWKDNNLVTGHSKRRSDFTLNDLIALADATNNTMLIEKLDWIEGN